MKNKAILPIKLSTKAFFKNQKTIVSSKRYLYWIIYTVLFLLVFRLGYRSFFENGKSFVWYYDGTVQHYPAMVYLGTYFREILRSLARGELRIPLFDFNLGMGTDIWSTFSNLYGFGDPLVFLSTFFPPTKTESLYNFLVIFRLYLSGIFFSIFCFYHNKPRFGSLLGTISYVFSGYALFTAVRDPSFINSMYFLPIWLIGIDEILIKKRNTVFLFAVWITALTGFYFLFILSIFCFIYFIIRFFTLFDDKWQSQITGIFFRFSTTYVFSLILAAFILLPAVLGFLGSPRRIVDNGNLLFYSLQEYVQIFLRSISPSKDFGWNYLGLPGITIMGTIALLLNRNKKFRGLKVAVLVGILFLLIPFGGYLANGLSYVSGRWTFVFSFLLSFILVEMPGNLSPVKKSQAIGIILYAALYLLLIFINTGISNTKYYIYAFVMYIAGFAAVLLTQEHFLNRIIPIKFTSHTSILRKLVLLVVVTCNCILNANFLFSEKHMDYASAFIDTGDILNLYKNSAVTAIEHGQGSDFFRFDSLDTAPYQPVDEVVAGGIQNQAAVIKVPMVQMFYSIINGRLSNSLASLEDAQLPLMHNVKGLDTRTMLETLFSVRFLALKENELAYAPFGFTKRYEEIINGQKVAVFENQNALPLGYTYSSYITTKEYNLLNPLKKQESLLQSAVLLEKSDLLPQGNPTFTSYPIEYTIKESSTVTWNQGKLVVPFKNARMIIEFQPNPKSETYFRLGNLMPVNNDSSLTTIKFITKGVTKTIDVRSPASILGQVSSNYLVNLGYSNEGKNQVTVVFPKKGTYQLGSIELLVQPFTNYINQVEKLNEETLQIITIGNNLLSGNIEVKSNKLLCISIPYSKGWSSKVDGKQVEILPINGMFMGIPLVRGQHEIVLTYLTPGLKPGLILSSLGLIALLLMICVRKFRQKEKFDLAKKNVSIDQIMNDAAANTGSTISENGE